MDAGRADDQGAAGRHRQIGRGLHRLARPQALQDHRRAAGIGRRRDPGVDAEIGRRHHALPVEGRHDALGPLAAGGHEGRHHKHRHQRAHRERIAQGEPRRRHAGLEGGGRPQRTLDMRAPERDRIRIGGRDRHLVGDRGRRSMRQPGIAIEPTQAVMPARQTQRQQRGKRRRGEQEKDAETDRASDRRQREPQPEPRDREEQADHGRDRGQARPEPFPEDRPARPPQRPRQHLVAVPLRWGSSIGGRVRGTVGQVRLLRSESCLIFDTNTQINACQRAKGRHLLFKTTALEDSSNYVHSQGGSRSSAISSAISRRGRTRAHSPARTSTSGTSARVL